MNELRAADMASIVVNGLEWARDTPERLLQISHVDPAMADLFREYGNDSPWNADVIELKSEVSALNQFHMEYARGSDSI